MCEIDSKKEKQFQKMERAIFRMTHQLNDVLDFIKKQPLKFERIYFSHVMSETLDSIPIPHKVKLILPKNDLKILCDKTQFSIVMNNLILDAIQAMDTHKGKISVTSPPTIFTITFPKLSKNTQCKTLHVNKC